MSQNTPLITLAIKMPIFLLAPLKLCVKFPADGEVYSKQHYVIKFVSELQEVCSFSRYPVSSKKTDHHDTTPSEAKHVLTVRHIATTQDSLAVPYV
jgi:hypothetical protein